MEINYELDARDLIAFQKHFYKTSPTNRNLRRYLYLFFVAFAAYFNLLEFRIPFAARLFWFAVSLGVSLLVMAFWSWVINAYAFKRTVPTKPDNGVLGPHQLILSEKALTETTPVNETTHSWKGVDRIEQNEDYVYIFVTPQAAHIVPKRFFFDRPAAEHFYDTARRYKEGAQLDGAAGGRSVPRCGAEGELSPVEKVIRA